MSKQKKNVYSTTTKIMSLSLLQIVVKQKQKNQKKIGTD